MQDDGDRPKRISGRWRKVARSFRIDDAPDGIWYQRNGPRWQVEAATRSPLASVLVLFLAAWLAVATKITWNALFDDDTTDHVQTWLIVLFWLATIPIAAWTFISIFGRVGVVFDKSTDSGFVYTGVGWLKRKRPFHGAEVIAIETCRESIEGNRFSKRAIVLRRDAGDIRLGIFLSHRRRRFLVDALNHLLP